MAVINIDAIDAQIIASNMEAYLEYGAESRSEYLSLLADEHGVDLSIVEEIADLFGPIEDFDGLVSALQDMQF